MKRRHTVRVAIVAAVAGVIVGLGATAAVTAGASGPNTTFYACLKSGKLTNVGTVSPTCKVGAVVISWNSQGPAGTPGTNGTNGTNGSQGPAGPQGPQGPAGATVNTCSSPPGPNLNFNVCNLVGAGWYYMDLRNSTFIDATMNNIGLYGANLQGGNVTGANLTSAVLYGATMTGTNAYGANMSSIDGAYIDFTSSSMPYVNFTGANLYGTKWTGANAFDENFTNADLQNATLPATVLEGLATWSNTTCPDGTNSASYTPQTCIGHGTT